MLSTVVLSISASASLLLKASWGVIEKRSFFFQHTFLFQNVKSRAFQYSFLQRPDHGFRFNNCASGGVNKDTPILHERNIFFIDKMSRFRSQRHMKRNNVSITKKGREIHRRCSRLKSPRLVCSTERTMLRDSARLMQTYAQQRYWLRTLAHYKQEYYSFCNTQCQYDQTPWSGW